MALLRILKTAGGLTTAGVAAFLMACAERGPTGLNPPREQSAAAVAANEIEGRYIILFRPDVANPAELARNLIALHGGSLSHVYQFAVTGFSVAGLPSAAVDALRRNPLVRAIEPVRGLSLNDVQQLPLTSYSYQFSALWGLDRVDERQPAFNGQYQYSNCGAGVHIYIVDTGIRGGHVEWGYGRIGASVSRIYLSSGASPTIDQNGHGTGVASAAAGSTYGSAKCATLHSVRVVDSGTSWPCYGPCNDDVVAGIDWVAGNRELPAVMNVSIGARAGEPGSFALRNALEGAIAAGVVTVKSAGNDNRDAFEDRSNRAGGLILVGATDRDDTRSLFCCGGASNFGTLLTLFAPGSAILTANKNSDTDTLTRWGTSFAAPVTAGVAALLLQQEPGAGQSRIRDVLVRSSTVGILVGDLGTGSPNRFVYSRAQAASYPVPPQYPTAPTIGGPDMVKPYNSCLYYAVSGSVSPVTYEWYLDGILQSQSGLEFRAPAGTESFQLEIHIVDSDGSSWWNYKYVTVSSAASECFDA